MAKKETDNVRRKKTTVSPDKDGDYISLTDMVGYRDKKESQVVVFDWMSTFYTIEFLSLWEQINNPDFSSEGYDTVRNMPGRLFVTPKYWVEMTGAIGIFSKTKRCGGGIFAHKDIAFEFGGWLSIEFKYLLIRDFQRFKEEEQSTRSIEWNWRQMLLEINDHIHDDVIKKDIVPAVVTKEQLSQTYACETDLLNVALFGQTAAQWRDANPGSKGNIHDNATLKQLMVLSNMVSINALFIRQGLPQGERLVQLNTMAIAQMRSLSEDLYRQKPK